MTRSPLKAALSIVVALASAFCGCGRSHHESAPAVQAAASAGPVPTVTTDLELVKKGTLPGYPGKTIATAFEKTFQDPEWKNAINIQGDEVVAFHGTVKYAALREAGFYVGTWNGVAQGIKAEKEIAVQRHRCYTEAGLTELPTSDEAVVEPCMKAVYQSMAIPVSFEFSLSPDKKITEMTLADPIFQKFDSDHRLKQRREATLAFIYQ
jgi:hypothetical protein